MKVFNSFLIGALSLFMFACQSELTDNNEFNKDSDFKVSDYEVSPLDAVKKFSHTPTGEVYVETPNQPPVKIDFSCSDGLVFQISDKDFILLVNNRPWINAWDSYDNLSDILGKIDTVRMVGQLISVYNGFAKNYPSFRFGWSNSLYLPTDGDCIYSTFEYLLAQACFQDDCSSTTRKAVLKAAIEKQTYKFEEYQVSYHARRTGLFLMAVIMVKEKYIPFIEAVHDSSDLKSVMQLNNVDDLPIKLLGKEFSDSVSQYAIQFLSN